MINIILRGCQIHYAADATYKDELLEKDPKICVRIVKTATEGEHFSKDQSHIGSHGALRYPCVNGQRDSYS